MEGELEDKREKLVQKLGENIVVRRIYRSLEESSNTGVYLHSNKKIACVVCLEGGNKDIAKEIAMHAAATSPSAITPEDIPKELIEKEREIFVAQSSETNKPQEIINKMVEGKIKKFINEVSLSEQQFVKDPDKKIRDILSKNDSKVLEFRRFEVGEGIEIDQTDFATEVNHRSMLNEIIEDTKKGMEKSLNSLDIAFKKIRTGRASPALLDEIKVDYYGTLTPLSQLANISVEDAKTLAIIPWEKSIVQDIEKTIMESDLGINPATSGDTIRVILPDLTEERRIELTKVASQFSENAKISIRNIRRDAMDKIKDEQKNNIISEDEQKVASDDIQKMTDENINKIQSVYDEKKNEIMQV